MIIDYFTRETQTSLFVQDVTSSVNYDIKVFDPNIQGQVEAAFAEGKFAPIVLWDLDSFKEENEKLLHSIRAAKPDTLIFAYAENVADYGEICKKYADTSMNAAMVQVHLMSKLAKLKEIGKARRIFQERMSHLVGKSDAVKRLRKTVERAILHSGPVLIQGESGVGKDLIAKAIACIYDKFVIVNCSAIPENLFESELFGHTRGAFTGAQNERIGLFEDANGGAIFLDEIGDMPLHAQVKLLRVIQNKEIRPIGSNKTRHVDVRIIAATNRDLREEIREKRFREDLYYRLNVIPVQLSPLRERKEDIEDLANYFIRQYAAEGESYCLSPNALDKLMAYDWPGNIRELENVIQRALCFTDSGNLTADDLQIDDFSRISATESSQESGNRTCYPDADNYDEFREKQLDEERNFLKAKILENGNSISATAEHLGMLRTALYNRLSRLGVSVKETK